MAETAVIAAVGPSRPTAGSTRTAARRQDFAKVLARARRPGSNSPAAKPEPAARPPEEAEPRPAEESAGSVETTGADPGEGQTAAAQKGTAEKTDTAADSSAVLEVQKETASLPEPAAQDGVETSAEVLAEMALVLARLSGGGSVEELKGTLATTGNPALSRPAGGEGAAGREPVAREGKPAPALEPEQDLSLLGNRTGTEKTAVPAGLSLLLEKPPTKSSSFDLLNFSELMDPRLKVDAAPQHLLERLQQATGLGSSSPLLDRLAETTLPQVVRGMVTLVREGLAEMRLQLDPPDLGQIELRVKTAEGVVRGEMLVQHSAVKHLLDSQVERLRTSLADQGLALQGFDVGVARDGRFAQPDQAWQQSENGGGSGWQPARAEETSAPEGEAVPVQSGSHEIDYLA